MLDTAEGLVSRGFARIDETFATSEEAFEVASGLTETCRLQHGLPPLSIIGDFVIPPIGGAASRDFQTLHFDFGLPIDPKLEQDVARYTALHVPAGATEAAAVTRLVPLAQLLGQRTWPGPEEVIRQLVAYGRTHGAWDDELGYAEGSLARLVEAAAGEPSPLLPSVKTEPGFLCGLEFDSLLAELTFFQRHGLDPADVEIGIALRPGELLVFDNLVLAHGRRGTRRPGELRQRVFGHRLAPAAQRRLRDEALGAFQSGRLPEERRAAASRGGEL